MTKRFDRLGHKAQRGSKPRCHLLTSGPSEVVAARLTTMADPFATVSPMDRWMPQGFVDTAEAELDKADRLLDAMTRQTLAAWWLPPERQSAKTPNFDIASTCTIDGRAGLLLIEAKAHDQELMREADGRPLPVDASEERKASHPTIGLAIDQARKGLTASTGQAWKISRDSHYQIANRFAWSWKLAELGVPVVLIYLGFLRAAEMADKGKPFVDEQAWTDLVLEHGQGIVPADVWGRRLSVNGVPLVPLICSLEMPLAQDAAGLAGSCSP